MLLPNYPPQSHQVWRRFDSTFLLNTNKSCFLFPFPAEDFSPCSAVNPEWLQQVSDNVELQLDAKHNVNVII